jgi:hypothetical protein
MRLFGPETQKAGSATTTKKNRLNGDESPAGN